MSYFQLFGTTMRFSDPVYMTKLSLSYACIPLAFYLALSALVGRKIAAILSCAMVAFIAIAFLLGVIKRGIYLADPTGLPKGQL
jgi:purine-cytosine permease-like protein